MTEIEDAYEAHVRALHARENAPRTCTLTLDEEDMEALRILLSDLLAKNTQISANSRSAWHNVLRRMDQAIASAK